MPPPFDFTFIFDQQLNARVFSILFCFGFGVQCVAVASCCQANSDDHCCADEHECKLQ